MDMACKPEIHRSNVNFSSTNTKNTKTNKNINNSYSGKIDNNNYSGNNILVLMNVIITTVLMTIVVAVVRTPANNNVTIGHITTLGVRARTGSHSQGT